MLMLCLIGRYSTVHQSRNKFVETSLAYALTYVSTVEHCNIGPASITILADSDYYSHPGASSSDVASPLGRFVDFDVPLHHAHKTGLGSSAALVTPLTAAVVAHFVPPIWADFNFIIWRKQPIAQRRAKWVQGLTSLLQPSDPAFTDASPHRYWMELGTLHLQDFLTD